MTGIDHLLDSNIVIGLLKGDPAVVALALQSGLTLSRAGVSQITRMELLGFPAITPAEEQATRALLNLCQVIGISDAVDGCGGARSGLIVGGASGRGVHRYEPKAASVAASWAQAPSAPKSSAVESDRWRCSRVATSPPRNASQRTTCCR